MKRPYQIVGAVLFLFSVLIVRESLELRFYTALGPGPGFFPFWLSVLLGGLAALMAYHATFRQAEPMPADFFATKVGYARIGAILVAMIGIIVLMQAAGFRLAMLLFYVSLLFALGRQSLLVTVVVALAGSFGVYHLFVQWLQVPLPTGIFGF